MIDQGFKREIEKGIERIEKRNREINERFNKAWGKVGNTKEAQHRKRPTVADAMEEIRRIKIHMREMERKIDALMGRTAGLVRYK